MALFLSHSFPAAHRHAPSPLDCISSPSPFSLHPSRSFQLLLHLGNPWQRTSPPPFAHLVNSLGMDSSSRLNPPPLEPASCRPRSEAEMFAATAAATDAAAVAAEAEVLVDTSKRIPDSKFLPFSVNDTLTVESWGTIYEGPGQEKYWSIRRRRKRHPYPVGYMAMKVYKGRMFRQTVKESPDGPLFVVEEIGKDTSSSNTATKAWCQLLQDGQKASIRVNGNRHFGFDNHVVQNILIEMAELHLVTSESDTEQEDGGTRVKSKQLQNKPLENTYTRPLLDNNLQNSPGRANIHKALQSRPFLEVGNASKEAAMQETVSSQPFFEGAAGKVGAMPTIPGRPPHSKSSIPLFSSFAEKQVWKKRSVLKEVDNDHSSDRSSRRQQPKKDSISGQGTNTNVEHVVADGLEVAPAISSSVSKMLESSRTRKKDESLRSSRSLLELLQKWNKLKKWEKSSVKGMNIEKEESKALQMKHLEKENEVGKDEQQLQQKFRMEHATNIIERPVRKISGLKMFPASNESIPLEDSRTEDLDLETKSDDGAHVATGSFLSKDTQLLKVVEERTAYASNSFSGTVGKDSGMHQQGKSRIKLVGEIRELITCQKFEDALSILRDLKLSGVHLDEFVYESFFLFRFDPWQKQVLRQSREGNSVLVCAPSGAGKSAAAECCLYENLIKDQRALYVTSCEELARQAFSRFQVIFGGSNVGGIWQLTRTHTDAKLVVISLDSLVKVLRETNGPGGSEYCFFFNGITLAVLDKFHTIGQTAYGHLWEEVLMLLNTKIKILGLSLPASNVNQIVSWINGIRVPCKLVNCRSDPVPKKYFFCDGSGIHSLLDSRGTEINSILKDFDKVLHNGLSTQEQRESFFSCGYDKNSLRYILGSLEEKLMLPATVVFFNVEGCVTAFNDACKVLAEGFLSVAEVAEVESRLRQLGESNPELISLVDEADRKGLLQGLAAYHEGKLPFWQHFVSRLAHENLVKLTIMTNTILFQTDNFFRTIVLPSTRRILKNGIFPLISSEFSELRGVAGRRQFDTEGNVVFLKSFYSGPKEAVSLVLEKEFIISSCFKPSYSLLLNLLAKHSLSKVKKILGSNFTDFVSNDTSIKDKELEWLDQKVLECLKTKATIEVELSQELTKINKKKLLGAAMFTRVNMRSTTKSASTKTTMLPGVLLAMLPGLSECFYIVFGGDNKFRLLPAGAIDYVYTNEQPFDVTYKLTTGQTLQIPSLPAKGKWTVEEGGLGYIASGSPGSRDCARMLMQHMVRDVDIEEGLHMHKEIKILEKQISNMIKRRTALLIKNEKGGDQISSDVQTETWKESIRLLKIMESVDAFSICETHAAYLKLNPLGVLISRLHNVENELWIAMVLMSKSIKPLLAAEFAAIATAILSNYPQTESLLTDQRELTYKVIKHLQGSISGLENLQKQVAVLQGSYNPPIPFDKTLVGMVYAWARGKPGTGSFQFRSVNEGGMASLLRRVATFLNLIHQACSQIIEEESASNPLNTLSVVAKKAEILLARHLSTIDVKT